MLITKNIDLHDFGGRVLHKAMRLNVIFTLQLRAPRRAHQIVQHITSEVLPMEPYCGRLPPSTRTRRRTNPSDAQGGRVKK